MSGYGTLNVPEFVSQSAAIEMTGYCGSPTNLEENLFN